MRSPLGLERMAWSHCLIRTAKRFPCRKFEYFADVERPAEDNRALGGAADDAAQPVDGLGDSGLDIGPRFPVEQPFCLLDARPAPPHVDLEGRLVGEREGVGVPAA